MKKFLLATIGVLVCACGGDDNGTGPLDPTPPAPTVSVELTSQSISNGAEVDAATTTLLTLTYNTAVTVTSQADITLNGSILKGRNKSDNNKAIEIPLNLQDGADYTLKVAQGAVIAVAAPEISAPALVLTFKTKTKEQPTPEPATASPVAATTDAAKKLYAYFWEQYGNKVISSVMANVNWNNECAEKVYQLTGIYPAMNCYDFIQIYVPENNWINYNDITPVKQWYEAGGIVQLMWHFNVPVNASTTPGTDGSGVTCTPSQTTFRAKNVFTEGSWENKWFYEQMDKVIAVLLKLQDAGIAATWRPFHEAAGNATYKQQASWTTSWFWWGYDGAEVCKKLWVAMFDYFKLKGVNNLIWIWTTQNYNGDATQYYQDTDWYPGDQYVDMVARDLYGYNAAKNQKEFTEIQNRYLGKMVVLGECGKDNNSNTEAAKMSYCWTAGAKWGHFLVWYQGGQGSTNTMCSDSWWKDAMTSNHVITRDQLPNLK